MSHSLFDISIGTLGAILLLIFAFIYSKQNENEIYKRYYLKGVAFKILGALIFIFTYIIVYGDLGDSFFFFLRAEILYDHISTYPSDFFEILFSSKESIASNFSPKELNMLGKSEDYFFTKVTLVLMYLGFKNYFLMSLIVVITTFFGAWKLFLALIKRYPGHERLLFISIFLVPSVLFWSSTLMKDAFALGLFNLFVAQLIGLKNRFKIINLIMLLILLAILSQIKAYVIISFLPALILYIFLIVREKIDSSVIKFLFTPFMFAIIIILSGLGMLYVGEISERYKLEELEARTKGFHTWHTSLGGSSYDLGEIDYSLLGVLKKAPEAMSVTLIRPFPNEIKNSMMVVGATESLIFIFLIFYFVFIKMRFITWVRTLFKDPFLISSLVFVLIFSFVVGFTSYNYGALFRYKIPCMSFYFLILVLPYYLNKNQVKES